MGAHDNLLLYQLFFLEWRGAILFFLPISGPLRARVLHPNDDEDVLELRLHVWYEGPGSLLLEDERDDVVSDVALSRQLLAVVGREREEGAHVEHELVAAELAVHRVLARRVV